MAESVVYIFLVQHVPQCIIMEGGTEAVHTGACSGFRLQWLGSGCAAN